jgi:hypothetical protein
MLRLEQLSYYQHLSLTGAPERPIFAYRIVDIRDSRFHVLTRLQDAGLDFTGRTNFTAHHLAFTPEETRQLPAPAIILRDWSGWLGSWTKEAQLLSNENWGNLNSLAGMSAVPAHTWQRLTGDAANGYGLLEAKAGTLINADGIDDKETLSLLAESTELMEVRETRRDYKAAAWKYTFTTSMQEQDNPADFRWRFVHSDSSAFAKLAGAECRPLCSVRPSRWTDEEASLARAGRRKPSFLAEPEDGRTIEGQSITFHAQADGIPHPDYEWFEVDRAGNAKGLVAQGPELAIPSPVLGLTRYVVRASNSAGEAISRVALLSVEGKVRLQRDRPSTPLPASRSRGGHIRSAEDIDKQRSKLEVQKAEEMFRRKKKRKVILGTTLSVGVLVAIAAGVIATKRPYGGRSREATKEPSGSSASKGDASRDSGPRTGAPPAQALAEKSEPQATNAADTPTKPAAPEAGSGGGHPGYAEENYDIPPPWEKHVVGQPIAKTSAHGIIPRYVNITGGGAGFGDKADNFFFVQQPASNSVVFAARLAEVRSPQSLCGIMIRESDEVDAPFAFIGASRWKIFSYLRGERGATPTSKDDPNSHWPVWLRITRITNSLCTHYSYDEKKWISLVPPKQSSLPKENYLLGFAVCSDSATNAVPAKFELMAITNASPAETGP